LTRVRILEIWEERYPSSTKLMALMDVGFVMVDKAKSERRLTNTVFIADEERFDVCKHNSLNTAISTCACAALMMVIIRSFQASAGDKEELRRAVYAEKMRRSARWRKMDN
jgi:hypothetical protein